MLPLIEIGPLRLSAGGLLLLAAVVLAGHLAARVARARGGPELAELVERCQLPVAAGALVGARLWYGLLNPTIYGPDPLLLLELRIGALAWPGAIVGGMLAGWLWCRHIRAAPAPIADAAALALPPAQALASVGLLLSGEALGLPTSLPWAVDLLGADRHPTQLYFAVAALATWGVLAALARRDLPGGALAAAYVALTGLSMLLLEPLRADSLLLAGGVRAAQVAGLALTVGGLAWLRRLATG